MKILVNDLSHIRGNNRVPVTEKIKFWQKEGVEVHILCTTDAKEWYEQNLQHITYYILDKSANPSSKIVLIFEFMKRNAAALRFLKAIRNEKYDVIYSLSAVPDLLIVPYLLKLSGERFVWGVVFDNTVSYRDPGLRIIKLLAFIFFEGSLILLRKADFIFAVTEELKDFMIRRGFSPEKLVTTGNAVEAQLIKESKVRGEYLYDGIFIGRIDETKGIYDLLDALVVIKKEYPDFLLAIMGRGDESSEAAFEKRVRSLGLQENIKMLGFKAGKNKFDAIKSSKIFLFLSPKESFGVALLEAVCSGLKCVVYDIPVYRSLYKGGEVVFVQNGDVEGAAQEVIKILKSGDFVNIAGERLLEKYSWDSIAQIEFSAFRGHK